LRTWYRGAIVSTNAADGASLIESSFRADENKPGNFEVLVPEVGATPLVYNLVHYWRDNSDPNLSWHRGVVVSPSAEGPASLIESSFRADKSKPGNFEALVLEATGDGPGNLVHYWRDNSDANLPWYRGAVVSSFPDGPACLMESSFRATKANQDISRL